jgi:hypothetical protein
VLGIVGVWPLPPSPASVITYRMTGKYFSPQVSTLHFRCSPTPDTRSGFGSTQTHPPYRSLLPRLHLSRFWGHGFLLGRVRPPPHPQTVTNVVWRENCFPDFCVAEVALTGMSALPMTPETCGPGTLCPHNREFIANGGSLVLQPSSRATIHFLSRNGPY